jgi:type I restriction enzyme S subunit
MLPNKEGITYSSGLPKTKQTQAYQGGDVLVSNIRPYFKKIWLADREGGCSNDILVFRAKKGVSSSFLYYVLSDNNFFNYATATAKGTKMPRGDKAAIMRYNVPKLPIDMQSSIGKTLSSLDLKIIENKKINHHLEQMAQAIFRYWFIERMSQSYDYQSDLIFRSLFDFANYINGTSFKKDEYSDTGIPIIKIAELKNGITNSTQRFSGEKDEKYYIKNKDILFSWSGNPETSIDIFLWASGEAILNQHTFIVKTNDGTPWFVYHLLKHFKKEFSHIASNKQTTGLGHVTVSDLRRLQFPYDLELMKAFEQIVSPIMETYYRNLCENQQLAFLRDSLLPKLMSGELSVSDIQAAK